jgi:hypothetical protein
MKIKNGSNSELILGNLTAAIIAGTIIDKLRLAAM